MKNFLVVALSVAFSVVMSEGFLMWRPQFQALVPFSEFVICTGSRELWRPHELLGWTAAPEGAYFERRSEAEGWEVHIYNADGYRDLYDSGDEHVIVLGDSFTEGLYVSNDESFPYLLDLWNPEIAFHNFGAGGYGTKNSLSVYEFFSPKIEHDLVILAYFLGNDLRDNIKNSEGEKGRSLSDLENNTWYEQLKGVNSMIRQDFRSYNLLYSSIRSMLGKVDLSDEQIAYGLTITEDLLSALASRTRDNGADLLLVELPSWNQMMNYGNGDAATRQRALLKKVAEEWSHIHLVDITDVIVHSGVKDAYGIKDKHFSRYGYYLAAKVVHDWINFEWPRGHRPGKEAPPFRPPSAPRDPDCASMPRYRELFAHPPQPGSRTSSAQTIPLVDLGPGLGA